jgi:hypothetical protein
MPQPNLGISPAKARRRKGFEEKNFFSELGVFAPWREEHPNPMLCELCVLRGEKDPSLLC